MINTNVSKQYKNTLKHNTMKKRIILATIAVAIIAGVSIFAACTKEENKESKHSQPFAQNKDYVEYFTDGTIVLATYHLGSTLDPEFNFNYDDFVSILVDSATVSMGYDVIFEDMQIIDDSLRRENCQALLKLSLYCPTYEESSSFYLVLDKRFDYQLRDDNSIDTTVYYVAPNGGQGGGEGNGEFEPVYYCRTHHCNAGCTLIISRDPNTGQITSVGCTQCPDIDGYCNAKISFWGTLLKVINNTFSMSVNITTDLGSGSD